METSKSQHEIRIIWITHKAKYFNYNKIWTNFIFRIENNLLKMCRLFLKLCMLDFYRDYFTISPSTAIIYKILRLLFTEPSMVCTLGWLPFDGSQCILVNNANLFSIWYGHTHTLSSIIFNESRKCLLF